MARNIDKYVCPFCCKTVDPARLHRSCRNPACAIEFLEKCSDKDRERRASVYFPNREIDVESSLHKGIDTHSREAPTTPFHIIYHPKDGKCDICGKKAPDALCPICHGPIPPDVQEGGNIIAVLGAAKAGKSHYTLSLIDVMRTTYCNEYGAEMVPAVPRTEEIRKILEDRLAKDADDESCTSEPMVYYLNRGEGENKTVHTLALFDTAGADLKSEGRLESIATGTLITGAAGIIFLVDAMMLPIVRERLRMPPVPDLDPAGRLEEIADTIRLKRHQLSRTVDVPLAVVITKVDALMRTAVDPLEESVLFGPESAINIPRTRGTYDEENLKQIDTEVEEYLRRFAGDSFMKSVERFRNHMFFVSSALGHGPEVKAPPVPFRVEDPLVWMFNRRED